MNTFIATFGSGMGYAGCYVEIEAADCAAAFRFMNVAHAGVFDTIYPAKDVRADVERRRLHRLAHVRQRLGSQGQRVFFDVVRPETAEPALRCAGVPA